MNTEPKPSSLNLAFHRVLCSHHGEPFRSRWPEGYPTFSIKALTALLSDDRFCKEVAGETGRIEAALDVKPICCRLDSKVLMSLYLQVHEQTALFLQAMCSLCGQEGLGADMNGLTVQGAQVPHICLECLVYRLRPNHEPANNSCRNV